MGSLTQTAAAQGTIPPSSAGLNAAGLDFAALLEAVALDPEAVLGKAAARSAGRRAATMASRPAMSRSAMSRPAISRSAIPESAMPAATIQPSPARIAAAPLAGTRFADGAHGETAMAESFSVHSDVGRASSASGKTIAFPEAKKTPRRANPKTESALRSALAKKAEPAAQAAPLANSADRTNPAVQTNPASQTNPTTRPGPGIATRKKPPKSLRAAASNPWLPADGALEQPETEAARLEELLAEDTVVIGAADPPQVPSLLDSPLSRPEERAARPEASARRWPGPRRKCVTISVRLSAAEAKTLRRRADESELSVSDYLRSCVLEADQLRAQVKQVLAEVRMRAPEAQAAGSTAVAEETVKPESLQREPRWRRWLAAMRSSTPQPMPSHR